MLARTEHRTRFVIVLLLAIAALLLLLVRPAAQTSNTKAIDALLRNAIVLADLISSPTFVIGDESVDGGALFRFYRLRDSRLAWSGKDRAKDSAAAMRALSQASDHGLDNQDYHLQQLAEIDPASNTEAAATYDLLLTDALLKYARDVSSGATAPNTIDADIDRPSETFDYIPALNSALENGTLAEFLAGLAPPHPEYNHLVFALARYRTLADDGGWQPIGPGADRNALGERLSREDEQAGRDNVSAVASTLVASNAAEIASMPLARLMVEVINPAANTLWGTGSKDVLSNRDWDNINRAVGVLSATSVTVAGGGALTSEQAAAKSPQWRDWSQKYSATLELARHATDRKSQQDLNAAGNALVGVCQGCHISVAIGSR
jgi:hypothetical protein